MSVRDNMVREQLERWRYLRAWGRSIENVEITVSAQRHAKRLGTCWTREQRLVVYQDNRITDMLATGLHEMAHAVEISDHHGVAWQSRFMSAVSEATGIQMPAACEDFHVIDCAAEDAVRRWWRGSSHSFAAKLLGVV
jgi:hypothetical protein